MEKITAADRMQFYRQEFPDYPPLLAYSGGKRDWLIGVWMIGNAYKAEGFLGSYPPSYLRRVESLFPDRQRVLHLFAGSLRAGPYTRVDLRPAETLGTHADTTGFVQGNAEHLAELFPGPPSFDCVFADPPYNTDYAKRYGTPMPNRRQVFASMAEVVEPGGHVIWLDTVRPMFRKSQWTEWGTIGVVRSTNHMVRMCFLYERKG